MESKRHTEEEDFCDYSNHTMNNDDDDLYSRSIALHTESKWAHREVELGSWTLWSGNNLDEKKGNDEG